MDQGRPTSYTPELADEICRRLAEGESVRQIGRDPDMPCDSTIRLWAVTDRQGFSARYADACQARLERWADEIVEIADDSSNDWIERERESGRIETVPNSEHINRSRLRVDTRKWLMSKLAPKRYGDRVLNEHSGPDGGPIETKDMTDADAARRVAFLLARALTTKEGE